MNRDIKFRIWNNALSHLFYSDECDTLGTFFEDIYPLEKDDVLMQYTGLKDVKGVEIYEGDVLCSDGIGTDEDRAIYTVEYHEPEFTRRIIDSERHTDWDGRITGGLYPHEIIARKLYVIGNRYENPELLAVRSLVDA